MRIRHYAPVGRKACQRPDVEIVWRTLADAALDGRRDTKLTTESSALSSTGWVMPMIFRMPLFTIDIAALFSLMRHLIHRADLGVIAVRILKHRR